MEYVIGPVLAFILSGGTVLLSNRKHNRYHKEFGSKIEKRVEALEVKVNTIDTEVPKRMLSMVAPVAVAVKQVKEEIGVE